MFLIVTDSDWPVVWRTCAAGMLYSYRYEWLMEETEKNVLRTHTTAVSARMLYKLAQQVSERKKERE